MRKSTRYVLSSVDTEEDVEYLGMLPFELFLQVASELDIQTLLLIASTSYYYLQQCFKTLEDSDNLLNLMSQMTVKEMLKFKKKYFHSTHCNLYRNLKEKVPTKLNSNFDYTVFLCYALLTDNTNELNQNNIHQLCLYLMQDMNKKHHCFIPYIQGIFSAAETRLKIFKSICFKPDFEFPNSLFNAF